MIKTARQLKDLIRNLSREKSVDAQILMRNYMMERFLERISLSEYRDKFILKGGMLVAATLASALLMPLPQIKKCFYRLKIGRTDEQLIAEMANIFEVSKQAMQIRLKSRNLI